MRAVFWCDGLSSSLKINNPDPLSSTWWEESESGWLEHDVFQHADAAGILNRLGRRSASSAQYRRATSNA